MSNDKPKLADRLIAGYCAFVFLLISISAFVGVVKFLAWWRVAFGDM